MIIKYLHPMSEGICPICGSKNVSNFIDLGEQPLANELTPDMSSSLSAEKYELALNICFDCLYVWLRKQVPPEKLFRHNTYLTGISKETQLDMNNFADSCIKTCYIEKPGKVIDIGSNDGTLLSFFNNAGFEVLGIEPSRPAYERAKSRSIPTINDFFGDKAADEALTSLGKVDIITGTNVITHVNDPISFLRNCKKLLKPRGSIVLEFYYFEHLLSNVAFDQIYHEHVSYFNFTTFQNLVRHVGLFTYKVEEVKSQGGSLRVFLSADDSAGNDGSVDNFLEKEGGFEKIKSRFLSFQGKVSERRREILDLIKMELSKGTKIAGYGASAKATVLLNYLGISYNDITAIADKSPIKQGKYLPGVGIPVVTPEELVSLNPDLIIIFPWNIRNEIKNTLIELFGQEKRMVTFMPHITFSF